MKFAKVLVVVGALAVSQAYAQSPSCICTAGCRIASDPFAVNADAPTSCSVKKAGTVIATSATVLSNTIPTSNTAVCLPADTTYVPGPPGSVACLVAIPPQPAGAVALVMTAINAKGGTDSPIFTFQSVSSIPSNPPVMPVGSPRIVP